MKLETAYSQNIFSLDITNHAHHFQYSSKRIFILL